MSYDDAVMSGKFNWLCWLPGAQLGSQGGLFASRVPTCFGRRIRTLQGDASMGVEVGCSGHPPALTLPQTLAYNKISFIIYRLIDYRLTIEQHVIIQGHHSHRPGFEDSV